MLTFENSRDFYEKLLAEFDDFIMQQDSARHAMNCAITAFHVHDWVWNDFLKQDQTLRARLGIGKKKHEFVEWIIQQTIWFSLVGEIANGRKHFSRGPSFRVPRANDFVKEAYAEPGYFASHFAIDQGEHVIDARYLPLSMLFEVVIRFWRDFFRPGRAHFYPGGQVGDLLRGHLALGRHLQIGVHPRDRFDQLAPFRRG